MMKAKNLGEFNLNEFDKIRMTLRILGIDLDSDHDKFMFDVEMFFENHGNIPPLYRGTLYSLILCLRELREGGHDYEMDRLSLVFRDEFDLLETIAERYSETEEI